MDLPCQPVLVDIPEQPTQPRSTAAGQAKLRAVDRQQTTMAVVYVEELIPADHKARAVWELVGHLDLSRFSQSLRTA